MLRKYKYFVSFFAETNGIQMVSACVIDWKIKGPNDINELTQQIKSDKCCDNVAIISINRL